MNQPLFKYTGSKRSIAKKIVSYFPDKFDTYYEPFLGGGSVFFEVLKQNKANKYILSDSNLELIHLFKIVQLKPKELIENYRNHWKNFQELGQDYYYKIREEFNQTQETDLFHFLMRTCYNGTIRYNSKGVFNTSCHFSRPGIHPDKLEKIILYYHNLMNNKDITFLIRDFTEIKPNNNEKSVVYNDPPYVGKNSLYNDVFNHVKFETWLFQLKEIKNCKYFFNLNGINSIDSEQSINSKLFSQKIALETGNSSFSRMHKIQINVQEYFYIN